MRDPGNPRTALSGSETAGSDTSGPDDPVRLLSAILRAFSLVAAFLVLVVSIYYAIHVFHRIGTLIADPTTGKAAVDAIANMIDASSLTIDTGNGDPIKLGKMIAFSFLLVCYILWFWLPMMMLKVSSLVILRSLPERGRDKT